MAPKTDPGNMTISGVHVEGRGHGLWGVGQVDQREIAWEKY